MGLFCSGQRMVALMRPLLKRPEEVRLPFYEASVGDALKSQRC